MFDGEGVMLNRFTHLGAAFIALLCAAAVPSAPALALEDIEMGTIGGPSAVLWPIYIGASKGMFAAENLNIKLTFVPSSAGVQQQLAAGALELSDAGLNDQVRAIFEGAPIALVRLEGQVPPYALLSQPAIKSIAELRGKTVMVGGEKDITRVYLERMLGQAGIKPGEYDLLYSGATIARFAALQSGAVSAAILYPPFNFRAESAAFTNLGLVVDYLKDLPFSGFSVNTAWAAQKKDRVQKFLGAYKKVAEIIEILRGDMRERPLDINRLFLPDVTQVTE
jgi:NitT/TauT family transport system substrate-binding protein